MKMLGHNDISTIQLYLYVVVKLRHENMVKPKSLTPDE